MDLYDKYQLTRVVNGCGKMTHLAGAAVLPDIAAQVQAALPCFFDLGELQEKSGEVIARATGAEWGCVTACTAAGIALGVAACRALIERYDVKGADLDGLVWGGVILPSAWANIAREIALDLPIPRSVEATTVTRVCTSGLYAITTAAAAIERGEVDLMIAGGGDSTSNAEIKMPQSLVHKVAPVAMSKKSTDWSMARSTRFSTALRVAPRIRSTGAPSYRSRPRSGLSM